MAAKYRLSARADQDLTEIYVYTFEEFGEQQADRYLLRLHDCMERAAREPGVGKAVRELAGDHRRRTAPIQCACTISDARNMALSRGERRC